MVIVILNHIMKLILKNEKKLYPESGMWTNTMWVDKPVRLTYCGIALYLNTDGTYSLEDTAGG